MKQKRLKWMTIMILLFSAIGIQAQNSLNVHERSGIKTSINLSTIQNLIFTSGNMTINKKDATTSIFSLTNLGYIDFSSLSTGIGENKISNQFILFPNPVQDVLIIKTLTSLTSEIHKFEIYGIDGKIVMSEFLNKNLMCVNVTSLIKGVYFCRIHNGINVTTTKFIKL